MLDTLQQPSASMPVQASAASEQDETSSSEQRAVQVWLQKIRAAKRKWEADFKRMKENARFAAGWQWPDQDKMDDDRYIVNVTNQVVNQKVATLYARNPTVVFKKRERLLYQLWDGRIETLASAVMGAQQAAQGGAMPDMQTMALIQDYTNGQRIKELLDKVGQTMEIVYKWMCDDTEPDFKKQMKQMVRRTVITGVGYVKQEFERSNMNDLMEASNLDTSMVKRQKMAQFYMEKLSKGDLDIDDERVFYLKSLLEGLQASAQYDQQQIEERLTYNFPKSWNIIPDEACTNIDGFIGADWVAEQFLPTLEEVNAFFQVDVQANSLTKFYNDQGQETELKDFLITPDGKAYNRPLRVCVYDLYNKTDKTHMFLLDGHPDFLVTPQPVEPCTKHFWPWFSVTFNDIEACDDPEFPVSPFPPSDVQQMKSAQKERNRMREELRNTRMAKVPKTLIMKGLIQFTEGDKDKIMTAPSNACIEVDAMPQSGKLSDAIAAWPTEPLEPAIYDVSTTDQDVLMATGLQEANIGPAPKGKNRESATAASIAEQSRITKSASNVDDLDGLLSDLALNGGQLLLQECSPDTVRRIVGPGAVWPMADKTDFVDLIYLEVEAASSGRPNKAMEVSNWERLGPVLQQLGANPHWMVRETIKRLDDRMDPTEAFPLVPPQNVPPSWDGQQQSPQGGQQQRGQAGGQVIGSSSNQPAQPQPQLGQGVAQQQSMVPTQ